MCVKLSYASCGSSLAGLLSSGTWDGSPTRTPSSKQRSIVGVSYYQVLSGVLLQSSSFSSSSPRTEKQKPQIRSHSLLTNGHCVQSNSSLQSSKHAHTRTRLGGGREALDFFPHYNTISLSSSDFLRPGKNSESITALVGAVSSLLRLRFLRKNTQSMGTLLFTAAVLMPFLGCWRWRLVRPSSTGAGGGGVGFDCCLRPAVVPRYSD